MVEIEKVNFKLEGDFIKLDQLLKASNIVSSGGEAKFLITEGYISLNNNKEFQRGKKIKKGDIISISLEESSISQIEIV